MSIYSDCCPYMGEKCKEDCEFAVNGKCEYEEKKECPFGCYDVPEDCAGCEYFVDDGCIFKKLHKISRELHELFPGLKCYVTDQGGLCIQASIINNMRDNTMPDFEDAVNIDINPLLYGTGAAHIVADVMSVDEGPACHYEYGFEKDDGTTEWEQAYPDQRFMINPECILWTVTPYQENRDYEDED